MALVYPFKGIRYKAVNEKVMAPPYDVIDKEKREKLIAQSDSNIVRITLPDSYDNAKKLVDGWLNNDILRFDEHCSYYIYTAEYRYGDTKKTLKGVLAALKLEPFGKNIKPHEKTLKGPKIDRFNLITKTSAMFCPIMGIYSSDNKIYNLTDEVIKSQKAAIDVEFENIRHRIYPVKDDLNTIHNSLVDSGIIIADGHHRYETALMIQEYYNKQGIKNGGFDYIMTLLIDAKDGGLSLFPIHRLIRKTDNFNEFMKKLGYYFDIAQGRRNCDFLMYSNGQFYSLTFKLKRDADLIKRLDVSIFEEYVYKKILGLTQDDIKNQKIAGYAHSSEEVINIVDKKEAEIGFILNPMDYKDLVEIAEEGLTVPQKSTFFYPKIPSGLVGYHFESIKGCNNV